MLRARAIKAAALIRKKLLYDPIDFVFGKAGYEVKRIRSEKTKAPAARHPNRTIDDFARTNGLILDRVSDMSGVTNKLIRHLRELGCFIQIIEPKHLAETKIAFKNSDFSFVIKCMLSFKDEDIAVIFLHDPKEYGHKHVIPFYFSGPGKVYNQKDMLLDAWIEGEDRVFTHTPNPFICSVPIFNINRTVSALHPYDLKGETTSDISLNSMLDVSESIDQNFDFPVDAVYTWVDGADEAWATSKASRLAPLHFDPELHGISRFRSIDELRYSLRSVLSFAPFIRNIFLVTDSQVPDWLDTGHSKIKLVDHKEIFCAEGALPTFNSHAIEANLHRIAGLAEHFLYINDDFMFWNRVNVGTFFHANGLTRSFLEKLPNVYGPVLKGTPAWRGAAINANRLLKGRFGKTLNAHHMHTPFALRRSVAQEMWDAFPAELERVTCTPFRSNQDISPVSFLYHGFSFATGKSTFDHIDELRMSLGSSNFRHDINRAIESRLYKVVCINDAHSEFYEANLASFYRAMREKFPLPAPWELDR